MSKILSIGAGVMGTAITVPAVSNGHEAKLVGTNFDEDIINSINKYSSHLLEIFFYTIPRFFSLSTRVVRFIFSSFAA